MPVLPAPFPFLPSGGDLAVSSTDDVLAAFPARVRNAETAPVRDAITEAMLAMYLAHQERVDYAAAQSDATRAVGAALDGLGYDRGIFRQDGEGNEAYRDRIFATPAVVTRSAIVDAVNQILAAYTAVEAQLFESVLDREFVRNDSDASSWGGAFITDGRTNIDPEYQDRMYDQRPNSHPGGAWAFSEHYGRYFVLRIPSLSDAGSAVGFMFDGTQEPSQGLGFFTDDGTDGDGSAAGFLYSGSSDATSIYQAIINVVERLRGHGVRWMLIIDPKLA
jgi:hypothetical protein